MSSSIFNNPHHLHNIQSKGYTILRDVIPKDMIASLRDHVRKGVSNRPQAFLEIANPADVLNQEVKQEDPRMSALKRKFAAHRQKKKKMMKEKRLSKLRASGKLLPKSSNEEQEHDEFMTKSASEATASDIAKLSQRITQKLAQLDPSDSRIQNDPQRLKAIDEHRCNIWMTEAATIGKDYIHSSFGKKIGSLLSLPSSSSSSSSFSHPTLFADRPLFQLPYGRPTMMHFAAPMFGLEEVYGSIEEQLQKKHQEESQTSDNNNMMMMNAISLWVPLEEPLAPTEENLNSIFAGSSEKQQQKMSRRKLRQLEEERLKKVEEMKKQGKEPTLPTPIRVLEGSHRLVRSKMLHDAKKYDLRLFRNDFNAVDSAIALWMRRFPELMMTTSMNDGSKNDNDNNNDSSLIRATELPDIRPGSVVAFDPYTFAGLGPNVSTQSQCVLQLLVMNNSDNNTTKPSIHPYSWIRDWKSTSLSVDFSNPIVFPKLY